MTKIEHRAEYLTNTYIDRLLSSPQCVSSEIRAKWAGNTIPEDTIQHLAQAAIWTTVQAIPTASTQAILKSATKLFGRWLREDYTDLFKRIHAVKKGLRQENTEPDQLTTCELASETFHYLDIIACTWGPQIAIWALLVFTGNFQIKEIFPLVGIKKPSHAQYQAMATLLSRVKKVLQNQCL